MFRAPDRASDDSELPLVWVCSQCGRHIPKPVKRCECGCVQPSRQPTQIPGLSAALNPLKSTSLLVGVIVGPITGYLIAVFAGADELFVIAATVWGFVGGLFITHVFHVKDGSVTVDKVALKHWAKGKQGEEPLFMQRPAVFTRDYWENRGVNLETVARQFFSTLTVTLFVGLLGYGGCEYRRHRDLADWRRERQLQQQTETLRQLNEQMEREHCQQFVRSTIPRRQDLYDGGESLVFLVCSNPQSAIRQRLRPPSNIRRRSF